MKEKKIDTEKAKWEKLKHYKCTICKQEFYFVKKEAEKDLKEDEFNEEPFLELPIFKDENKCPFCKASMKSILTILSDEEIKKKKEEELNKKKAEKEKLKEKLEEIAKEEERLDKLHETEINALCSEIFSDILAYLGDIEIDLRKGNISVDRFEELFLSKSFDIMQRDSEIYNKRNKEISLVLSNMFKARLREAVLDFNLSVRNSIGTAERKMENEKRKFDIDDNDLEYKEEKLEDDKKDEIKYELKKDSASIDDDFRKMLKNKLR